MSKKSTHGTQPCREPPRFGANFRRVASAAGQVDSRRRMALAMLPLLRRHRQNRPRGRRFRRRALRSRRAPHAGLVDEFLGRGVDRPAAAAARRVDIERGRVQPPFRCRRRRQRDFVGDRRPMVGEQQFGPVDLVQLEQAADEIGLAAQQEPGDDVAGAPQLMPVEVLFAGSRAGSSPAPGRTRRAAAASATPRAGCRTAGSRGFRAGGRR